MRGEFETPIAITNATVVTGVGPAIQGGTIVISNGRITEVGLAVEVPPHALRIDAAGLIVYPGFIDALTHLGIPESKRTPDERKRLEDENPDPREGAFPATRLANRRGIRSHLRAVDLIVPDEDRLKAYRAAGFTTALVAPRDGIFGGTSDLLSLSGAPIRQAVVAADVAMHGSFVVGEEGEYPATLLGIFAQFRQALLDARWHKRLVKFDERHPTLGKRPPVDASLDALLPLLSRSRPIIFEANSEREINRALDLTGEFNLDVIISGAKEAWKVRDRLTRERVPLIVSIDFDPKPYTGPEKAESADGDHPSVPFFEPRRLRDERTRLWEEQVANVIRLQEAGVPFALRLRDFKKPSEFFKNLRSVMERGLSEEAAVRALTAAPAEILGLADQLGIIAPGRIANLTVMSGSIADASSKVRYLFIDGRKFEPMPEEEKEDDPKDKKKDEDDKKSFARWYRERGPGPTQEPDWPVELETDRRPNTQTGGNVFIRDATVMPVSSPNLDRASILIRNGKIAAFGPDLPVPDDVTVIDAAGRFALPGFVDCHSHLALDAVNEPKLSISSEVRIVEMVDPKHVGLYWAAAGGTTTHHVMHGSANPIGGQNTVLKMKYGESVADMLVEDAAPTIKFALGENVTQANWQTHWGKRFPNTRMGVEQTIRGALQAARTYTAKHQAFERALEQGLDITPVRRDLRLETLADVLTGKLTIHAHCYRSEEILRLIATAEDFGIRVGTLQHVLEGYRIAPEIARHGCGASSFSNYWAYKVEAFGAIPHNAALLTGRGVNTSINSDSPRTIRYLGREAAKSMRWGELDENQVLRLVTLNPAMQLQIAHRVGSLEVGKDGDVALFNGHPLNSFSKCIMTLIDGEVYFEDPHQEPTEPADTLPVAVDVDRTIPTTPHRVYAVTNATIHPISGPEIPGGTVVIVEDRIHAVGREVTVPPGAGVIDGTNLHVYPGLIDAGSRIGLYEVGSLRSTRDYSEIGNYHPQLQAAGAIHPHSVHVRIARTGGITTALARPEGGRIAGQSAIIHLDGWTAPEMMMVDRFGLHMTVPSLPVHPPDDVKKRKKQLKEHKEAVRKLDEYMERAVHYARTKELAASDPDIEFELDPELEAMAPYIRGDQPVVFSANTYKAILDTLSFSQKYGLRCVLSGGNESWKLADQLAEKDIPVILNTPVAYPQSEFETWDSVYRCAGVLDRAGVRFCFASGNAPAAYNLGIEVGLAVAHGLPRERAEWALTLGAAEILGIADRTGSIEVGKLADLIVTTGSPLQPAVSVTHMFVKGRPIELTSKHTESYEKFKNRPEPHLPPERELMGPPNLTAK